MLWDVSSDISNDMSSNVPHHMACHVMWHMTCHVRVSFDKAKLFEWKWPQRETTSMEDDLNAKQRHPASPQFVAFFHKHYGA